MTVGGAKPYLLRELIWVCPIGNTLCNLSDIVQPVLVHCLYPCMPAAHTPPGCKVACLRLDEALFSTCFLQCRIYVCLSVSRAAMSLLAKLFQGWDCQYYLLCV